MVTKAFDIWNEFLRVKHLYLRLNHSALTTWWKCRNNLDKKGKYLSKNISSRTLCGGKCQEIPPQEALHTWWDFLRWDFLSQSVTRKSHLNYYVLFALFSLSWMILGPQVMKRLPKLREGVGGWMGVISAIWRMYFGQKQSRLIQSWKNARKTLSAVEWL